MCNHTLSYDTFDTHFAKHKVPATKIAEMRANWSKTKDSKQCVAWEFKVVSLLAEPLYYPWSNESVAALSACSKPSSIDYQLSTINYRL